MSIGPLIRTDVFDVYIFRRSPAAFLQLKRAEEPLLNTWQPIMGHVEPGEPTQVAMWRELEEEVGLTRQSPHFKDAWALEGVYPYYLARKDAIMMSPRFAIEVSDSWEPVLNSENSALRWVGAQDLERHFMWPGQRECIGEIVQDIIPASLAEPFLRL